LKNKIMNLLFLGTSSGWPLPRLGCTCHICSSDNVKDKRLRPSLLINETILIDAPPDIYHQIRKYVNDPLKINTIILTHEHDDHIMGLFDLSRIYKPKDKIEIISSTGVLSKIKHKMAMSMFSFKTFSLKPFEKHKITNECMISLIPVKHTVETYAVKIKYPKPILYAPEFKSIPKVSKKQLGDLDLLVMDGSSKTLFGSSKGHETIEEGIRLAKELRAKKIFFTNIGHKTDRHESLEEFVKKQGGGKFNIAFDGLELTV